MKHPEIIQRRLRYHEMQVSKEADISVDASPTSSYCIASTPRSGSTLISKMLLETESAGNPKEYLNPLLLRAWCRLNKKQLYLFDYLKDLQTRRTSPNGTFGMKVHWRHLEKLAEKKIPPKAIQSILNSFDKYVFISRKDKISQAISYYIAHETGIFHSDQEVWLDDIDVPTPPFNAEKILKHLSDIVREEAGWSNFFIHSNKPVLKVYYEDIVSNYQSESKNIIKFLGVGADIAPEMPTKKMSKSFTVDYKSKLLNAIGIQEVA